MTKREKVLARKIRAMQKMLAKLELGRTEPKPSEKVWS